MLGSAITWMAVPVSSLVNMGLGNERCSSAAASLTGGRAPENNLHSKDQPQPVNEHQASSGRIDKDRELSCTQAELSTADSPAAASSPQMATPNKSRPASRRQSTAGGTSIHGLTPLCFGSDEKGSY